MKLNSITLSFHDEAEDVVRLIDRCFDLPTQRKFKDSGAMVAPATIARTGIMEYSAGQLGALFSDRPATELIKVMTRAEDLFCADSLESYRSAPITIGHPDGDVTVENADILQKGNLDGIPFQDGENLAGNIVLTQVEALNLVDAGVDQLSSGHDAKLVRLSDEDALKLGYHAYKTGIRCNHIAIVPRGRAGNAKIADEEEQVKMYDQDFVSGLEAKLDAAQTEAEELKVKLADAQTKLSDEAIEARVKARLEFLQEAAQFTDADLTGLSVLEAKRVALKDACGKDYADRDEAFINVRYDILVEEGFEAETDMSQALRDHAVNPDVHLKDEKAPQQTARDRMIQRHSSK